MKSKWFLMVMGLMLVLFSFSSAQVPQMINYQGKLTNPSGAPVTDTLQMVFTIYADEAGTTPLWTETQSTVEILKGVFNVLLGSVNPIFYSVFDGTTRYLGVSVGGDPEITPRKAMVSVPYAYTDGDWTADGDSSLLYYLNGKIGIGTVSPKTTLQIGSKLANVGVGAFPKVSIYGGGGNASCLSLMAPGDPYWYNQMMFISDQDTARTWILGHLNNGYGNPANSFGWMFAKGEVLSPNNPKMALSPSAGLSLGDNYGKIAAPANGIIIEGNVGIGTTSPQRALHVSDIMRLQPRASAPSSPSEGDIYVNSTDHHIYCYLNGVWKQLDN